MKQKEEKKKNIRKAKFFQNPDEDNGSDTGTSLGKIPHRIPNPNLL